MKKVQAVKDTVDEIIEIIIAMRKTIENRPDSPHRAPALEKTNEIIDQLKELRQDTIHLRGS